MSFELTILGSSSAIPTLKRFSTAQILNVFERFFLIDCGEGTQIQLKKYSINVSKIHSIFLSHLHGDHLFGLFGLLSTFTMLNRKSDLHIYAHKDFEITLDYYKKNFGAGLTYQIYFHPFIVQSQQEIYSDKHVTVEMIPLRHSIPVAGFIFKEKTGLLNIRKDIIQKYSLGIKDIRNIKSGMDHTLLSGEIIPNKELTLPPFKPRSFAFCSDTLYISKLANVLKGVDLLYHEATFSSKDKKLAKLTGHSTASEAAKIALHANVDKLLIGHFSTRYKDVCELADEARQIFKNTVAVEDGDKYSIIQKRFDSTL